MKRLVFFYILIRSCVYAEHVPCFRHNNETELDPASQQLPEFRLRHPEPIGVLTKLSGEPLDIRDATTLNTDIFIHRNHFRFTSHHVKERIPERVVHAKGIGAFGYFEVTNDVSKYIKSDVFNSVGKTTPLTARFSTVLQNIGGNDLTREIKSISLKFYTKEGNLDLICLNIPMFSFKDPVLFPHFLHLFKRNPKTDMYDRVAEWDFLGLFPDGLFSIVWLASDFGLPDGYRKMDGFPIHVYEIYNQHGEQYYVRFNLRTEIGLANLTNAQAQALRTENPDYFNSDLYNAIARKDYPSWKLEMDILTREDLMKVDYDPFDVTRTWKIGTYKTVEIGRVVINRRVDNNFEQTEKIAFTPDNLVPGITGPRDSVFRARKLFYPDTQNYRLGVNHNKIPVNAPLYMKVYNRDGEAPINDNMLDAPNYFPNSFNGPMPYVDEVRSKENIFIYHRNAVDLQPLADFYNKVIESDAHRQRVVDNLALSLIPVPWDVEMKIFRIFELTDEDFARRMRTALDAARAVDVAERRARVAQCIANVSRIRVETDRQCCD